MVIEADAVDSDDNISDDKNTEELDHPLQEHLVNSWLPWIGYERQSTVSFIKTIRFGSQKVHFITGIKEN